MTTNNQKIKVLIPTEPDDSTALLVKAGLENLGHQVQLLFTADQPTLQKNSAYIDNHEYQYKSQDKNHCVREHQYDVVWWRRPRKPFIPRDWVDAEDYKFVHRENNLFFESLVSNLAANAWWINPKEAAYRTNIKLFQLKIARDCGLSIPVSLFSNDPQEIRAFCLKHESEGIIYKPICTNFWIEENKIKISYTSRIRFCDLPGNKVLQATPGIFQKEVRKKHELRITCFGDYLVTAKLNSQKHPQGQIDWRVIPESKMVVETCSLPKEIEAKIRLFMRKTGIVFGCFDFIVTEDNQYIFLEVNEQGQFLWVEEANADIPMLDIFIQFLLEKKREFVWDPEKEVHKIKNYWESVRPILINNRQQHIDVNSAVNYQN